MGVFDYYFPNPIISCAVCGSELRRWQGKDGPNALFVWQQGIAHPLSQMVDDGGLYKEAVQARRLPQEFMIFPETTCCAGCPVSATCWTDGEAWTETKLSLPSDR